MKIEDKIPEDFLVREGKNIESIFRRAVRQAILMHKRAGNPIAVWKDGKVVIIPPEDIIVDEDEPEHSQTD